MLQQLPWKLLQSPCQSGTLKFTIGAIGEAARTFDTGPTSSRLDRCSYHTLPFLEIALV